MSDSRSYPQPLVIGFDHTPDLTRRGWTHEQCWDCWFDAHPNGNAADWVVAMPTRISAPHRTQCCFCGNPNRSGIYVRHDPHDTALTCGAHEVRHVG
jgi:hypothetical protein